MADKTKLLLISGHEVTVEEEPSEVADTITRREDVHRFTGTASGTDVYVVKGQLAGFVRIPD
jgi:hypothetical protein